jgi:hypothetical protein
MAWLGQSSEAEVFAARRWTPILMTFSARTTANMAQDQVRLPGPTAQLQGHVTHAV